MSGTKVYQSRGAFIFGEPPDVFVEFETLENLGDSLRPALLAFKANLASAVQVGNIPFLLTSGSVRDALFTRLHIAAKIRALSPDPPSLGPAEEKMAYEKARSEFDKMIHDPERQTQLGEETLRILDEHLGMPEFKMAAEELLRQILVMSWAALEVLVNDTLRLLLNHQPQLVAALARSKLYRDVFSERRLIESLEANAFDLSSLMGNVFFEAVRLDSLEKIRELVHICLDDQELDEVLKSNRLWRLSQQRHLIVHRRGLVDSRYIEKTGDTTKIGEHLSLGCDYVESCLRLVSEVGCKFYRVALQKI